jgi:DNA-binding GntR family transcriptional regulator
MDHLRYTIDAYVLDTLMRDLVGHDRRPSAFLVYLTLLAAEAEGGAALSYAQLADRTGLSKRAAQDAVGLLQRRGLLGVRRGGATDIPTYQPLQPWRRRGQAGPEG